MGSRSNTWGFLVVARRFPPRGYWETLFWQGTEYRKKVGSSGGLLALVVIVDLVEQAAAIRFERPVIDAGRPAGVGRRVEGFAALAFRIVADDEIARDQ